LMTLTPSGLRKNFVSHGIVTVKGGGSRLPQWLPQRWQWKVMRSPLPYNCTEDDAAKIPYEGSRRARGPRNPGPAPAPAPFPPAGVRAQEFAGVGAGLFAEPPSHLRTNPPAPLHGPLPQAPAPRCASPDPEIRKAMDEPRSPMDLFTEAEVYGWPWPDDWPENKEGP
jgi:hypothetical protein